MASGNTAQSEPWKSREQAEEARYIRAKEQAQLAAIKQKGSGTQSEVKPAAANVNNQQERDFEGGFGGLEDLEDRYATTSGEH